METISANSLVLLKSLITESQWIKIYSKESKNISIIDGIIIKIQLSQKTLMSLYFSNYLMMSNGLCMEISYSKILFFRILECFHLRKLLVITKIHFIPGKTNHIPNS
jgi:hypothetical protein